MSESSAGADPSTEARVSKGAFIVAVAFAVAFTGVGLFLAARPYLFADTGNSTFVGLFIVGLGVSFILTAVFGERYNVKVAGFTGAGSLAALSLFMWVAHRYIPPHPPDIRVFKLSLECSSVTPLDLFAVIEGYDGSNEELADTFQAHFPSRHEEMLLLPPHNYMALSDFVIVRQDRGHILIPELSKGHTISVFASPAEQGRSASIGELQVMPRKVFSLELEHDKSRTGQSMDVEAHIDLDRIQVDCDSNVNLHRGL